MKPSPTNTFRISTPADYLDKLRWEIDVLVKMPLEQNNYSAFQVLNCATTAWHMCDWLVNCFTPDQVERYCNGKEKGREQLRAFQKFVLNESKSLPICRDLADTGKHRNLDRTTDPNVSTGSWLVNIHDSDRKTYFLFVNVGDGVHQPKIILEDAYYFWLKFLADNGLTAKTH